MATPSADNVGVRWVNHTTRPGNHVVNDLPGSQPQPSPQPPPFVPPKAQRWARDAFRGRLPPTPPAILPPSQPPVSAPSPYYVPPPPPPPPSLPSRPESTQTPPLNVPRFYDPDDLRRVIHGQPAQLPLDDSTSDNIPRKGFSFFPNDTAKRGPYAERITRDEEIELMKACLRYKDSFGTPATTFRWWGVVAADFSVYRRRHLRGEVLGATAKRRVELRLAKREKELDEEVESDDTPEYLEAVDAWLKHTKSVDNHEVNVMNRKDIEKELEEALERIKRDKEQAEKDHPMTPGATPPLERQTRSHPSSLQLGEDSSTPLVVRDSPPRTVPPQSHYYPTTYPPALDPSTHLGYALGAGESSHKRKRNEDDQGPSAELGAAMTKIAPMFESITKLANEMFEWRKNEQARSKRRRRSSSSVSAAAIEDVQPSPAPYTEATNDNKVEKLEKKLQEQRDANEALQSKVEEMTAKLAKIVEEATAAQTREKERDNKMDKILQVLKKHFQEKNANASSANRET